MKWYIADKNYVKQLHKIDSKVEYIDYGARIKPYLGVLLEINKIPYYVPISSPKPKHQTMNNSKDFKKIVDSKTNKLLAVLNINNMIPVPNKYIEELIYKNINEHVSFRCSKDCMDYINLLRKQLYEINKISEDIIESAKHVHHIATSYSDSKIAKRSCKFNDLEEYATKDI